MATVACKGSFYDSALREYLVRVRIVLRSIRSRRRRKPCRFVEAQKALEEPPAGKVWMVGGVDIGNSGSLWDGRRRKWEVLPSSSLAAFLLAVAFHAICAFQVPSIPFASRRTQAQNQCCKKLFKAPTYPQLPHRFPPKNITLALLFPAARCADFQAARGIDLLLATTPVFVPTALGYQERENAEQFVQPSRAVIG